MASSFDERVALITGAGSGIGLAIARQLALRGAAVALNDIDAERAAAAVAQIRAEGGRAEAFPGDVGDVAFVRDLVDQALDAFGHLDLAVANAGLTRFGDVFSARPEDVQQMLDVNLRGTFFFVQAASRHMRARGRGGRILVMSSNVGIRPHRDLSAYGMTKAGLILLTQALAVELAPHGIAINALAPGATITERTLQDDPNYEASWRPHIPDGRVGRAEDVALAALFLLSSEADHITGHTLPVDGGWTGLSRYPEPAPPLTGPRH